MVEQYDKTKDPYATDEANAFFEGYCLGKSISVQKLASDIDHFEMVCQLYDSYLKDKIKT